MRTRSVLAAGFALAALVAGCGAAPGGDKNDTAAKKSTPAPTVVATPDVAAAGDVTLTVWDQEVRGGQNKQMKQLNQEFMEKYPNVKIERTAKSFDDLLKTV